MISSTKSLSLIMPFSASQSLPFYLTYPSTVKVYQGAISSRFGYFDPANKKKLSRGNDECSLALKFRSFFMKL